MAAIRAMIDAAGRSDEVDLEIDGGVGPSTIGGAAASGVNVFVAGSSLFSDPLGRAHAVEELRRLAGRRTPRLMLGRPGPTELAHDPQDRPFDQHQADQDGERRSAPASPPTRAGSRLSSRNGVRIPVSTGVPSIMRVMIGSSIGGADDRRIVDTDDLIATEQLRCRFDLGVQPAGDGRDLRRDEVVATDAPGTWCRRGSPRPRATRLGSPRASRRGLRRSRTGRSVRRPRAAGL